MCERRRGNRRGVREGACIGVATMPQPWTLRLILNSAALAAVSPTLLFSRLWNAAHLNRSASELLVYDDIPVAVKCASISQWTCRKRRRKNSPCTGGCAHRLTAVFTGSMRCTRELLQAGWHRRIRLLAALLASVPSALVLADTRPPALLASVPLSLVL